MASPCLVERAGGVGKCGGSPLKPIPISPQPGNLRSALSKSTLVKTPPPLPRFADLMSSAPGRQEGRVRFNTCGPGESPSAS